jgi:hypothetical protein
MEKKYPEKQGEIWKTWLRLCEQAMAKNLAIFLWWGRRTFWFPKMLFLQQRMNTMDFFTESTVLFFILFHAPKYPVYVTRPCNDSAQGSVFG